MMKNIFKKIIYILATTILILILIFSVLFIYEKIYSLNDEVKWIKEDEKINNMNSQKLKNSTWKSNQFFWLYNDETIPPKSDKKRILVVGDSYVWGDGYNNANYIWWQQLRNKLLENGYNDVEIIAMGMKGFNTWQQHKMLKNADIANSVNPDLILFAYVDNDTEAWQNPYDDDPIWKKTKAEYAGLRNVLPNKLSSLLDNLYPNLYRKVNSTLTEKYSSLNGIFGMKYLDYEEIIHQELFLENYREYVLKPLKQYLENELGVPYLFIEMPFFPSDVVQEQINLIKDIYDEENMPFIVLSEDYALEVPFYDKDVYQITPANAHPSTKTTEFTSRKVLEILESNYPNILGEKTKVQMDDIIINDPMPRTIDLKKINETTFTFNYPKSQDKNSFLTMPIYEDYIKLNFMYPVDIKSIEITGDNINNINIYINKIDEELGYDDKKMYKVDYDQKYIWNLDCEKVSSINIHADIKNGTSSNLTIKIVKE